MSTIRILLWTLFLILSTGFIFSPIILGKLTVTALPSALYLALSDIFLPSAPYSVHPSGNPCKRSHSSGVSFLTDFPSYMPCLSCAVSVNEGSPFSFIRRPFCLLFSRSGVRTGQMNVLHSNELPVFCVSLAGNGVDVLSL